LQNVIERAAVELADSADAADSANATLTREVLHAIAPELFDNEPAEPGAADAGSRAPTSAALSLRERSRRIEADEIRAALDACHGDREQVCAMLGISKTTLWRKLNAGAKPSSSETAPVARRSARKVQ
jgi:propionate catabolism operon transcriptional regulator